MRSLILVAALCVVSGCSDKQPPGATSPASGSGAAQGNAQGQAQAGKAEVGKPAPDFKLKDLEGKEVSLSSYKGKTVVLEWFNPECPFVKKSHTKGSLKGLASTLTDKGVVWLAINSGAAGKQGTGVDKNKTGAEALEVKNPILLDESGEVGKMYGATNTPHMYVIDPSGVLVYSGAIDNSPDAEGESPADGKLVNYVTDAIAALDEKRAVATPSTKAYGCSVKY
ncbi:MAG: thioredoxin family protein [Polyangiaceae bacterium]|nr:thioredoxin family protein [Polyangiaceae bacterium]